MPATLWVAGILSAFVSYAVKTSGQLTVAPVANS